MQNPEVIAYQSLSGDEPFKYLISDIDQQRDLTHAEHQQQPQPQQQQYQHQKRYLFRRESQQTHFDLQISGASAYTNDDSRNSTHQPDHQFRVAMSPKSSASSPTPSHIPSHPSTSDCARRFSYSHPFSVPQSKPPLYFMSEPCNMINPASLATNTNHIPFTADPTLTLNRSPSAQPASSSDAQPHIPPPHHHHHNHHHHHHSLPCLADNCNDSAMERSSTYPEARISIGQNSEAPAELYKPELSLESEGLLTSHARPHDESRVVENHQPLLSSEVNGFEDDGSPYSTAVLMKCSPTQNVVRRFSTNQIPRGSINISGNSHSSGTISPSVPMSLPTTPTQHPNNEPQFILSTRLPDESSRETNSRYDSPRNIVSDDSALGLKQLVYKNQHMTMQDLASHVRSEECSRQSEKIRQMFGMAWIIRKCELKREGNVPRNKVYLHYANLCSDLDLKPLNPATFGKLVRMLFPQIKTRRLGVRGHSKYHYCGIVLKEEELKANNEIRGSTLAIDLPSDCLDSRSTTLAFNGREDMSTDESSTPEQASSQAVITNSCSSTPTIPYQCDTTIELHNGCLDSDFTHEQFTLCGPCTNIRANNQQCDLLDNSCTLASAEHFKLPEIN